MKTYYKLKSNAFGYDYIYQPGKPYPETDELLLVYKYFPNDWIKFSCFKYGK